MPHRNVPIFVPHLGCPYRCVFCDQNTISGHPSFREETVAEEVERALQTIPNGSLPEIAFFGGSFTGIDWGLMIRLLDLAEGYVRAGRVSGIRLSTRPDFVDREVLEILSAYSVREVELGIQSTSDRVLNASGRGHTARASEIACRMVREAGFGLVGQMMIGLPESTPEDEKKTAGDICRWGAGACRIYPTVVFNGTALCEMAKRGIYHPLTVREAVTRAADVLEIFMEHDVACLRIGLCSSEDLASQEAVYAGANHPALGELVWNEYYYRKLLCEVTRKGLRGQPITVEIPPRELSKVIGQHRCNAERLLRETGSEIRQIKCGGEPLGLTVAAWKSN